MVGRKLRINVSREICEDKLLFDRIWELVRRDIQLIEYMLPVHFIDALENTAIYFNKEFYILEEEGRGLCFHPSAQWLIEHGNIAEKEQQIECYKASDYCEWHNDQPMMILHEYAHAIHYKIGWERQDVVEAFGKALESKMYERVKDIRGGETRHYCLTNHLEYFAECSEAYWGKNDYFPFNRDELKQFDKEGYKLMVKIWEMNKEQFDEEIRKCIEKERTSD